MGEFKILPDSISGYVGEFNKCSSTLGSCAGQVDGIRSSLGNLGGSTHNIREALRRAAEKLVDEQRLAKDMGTKLGEIIRTYETAEKRVCGYDSGGGSGRAPGGGGMAPYYIPSYVPVRRPGEELLPAEKIWTNSDAWKKMFDYLTDSWKKDMRYDLEWALEKPDNILMAVLLGPTAWMMPNDWRDYLSNSMRQAIYGDFTEEGNAVGIALSVIIGLVPVAGQIADIRDIGANVIGLVNDFSGKGDKESKKRHAVGLVCSTVGLVPGIGDVIKNSDEFADAAKAVFKFTGKADEIAGGVKKVLTSNVADKIAKFNDKLESMDILGKSIDKVTDLVKGEAGKAVEKTVEAVKKASLKCNVDVDRIVRNVTKDIPEKVVKNVSDNAKKIVDGIVEEYRDNFKDDLGEKGQDLVSDYLDGDGGWEPLRRIFDKYTAAFAG